MIERYPMKEQREKDKILNDMTKINEQFYLNFDESMIHNHLHQILNPNERKQSVNGPVSCVGTGYWFRSFLIPPKLNRHGQPFDGIVINVPARITDNKESSQHYYSWWQTMMKLKKCSSTIPLIPPFHLLHHNKLRGIWTTLYGRLPSRSQPALHWQPLPDQIVRTQSLLAQNGFVIEDMIQIRCWNGIPFIHDLSDLKSVEKNFY